MNVDQQVAVVFFACCAAFGIGVFVFFWLNKNASLKRGVLLWGQLLADALMVGFMAWIGFPVQVFFLAIPALVLITALNLWGTKFCPYCGKTLIHARSQSESPFSPAISGKVENEVVVQPVKGVWLR